MFVLAKHRPIQKLAEAINDQDVHKQAIDSVPQSDRSSSDVEGSSVPSPKDTGVNLQAPSRSGDLSQLLRVESGYESLQGIRKTMEDAHVLLDDLLSSFPQLSSNAHISAPFAFYGVYDGMVQVVHPA